MTVAALLLGFIVAAAAAFSPSGVLAANHTVGGSHGWDLQTDLQGWGSRTTFHAGDKLVFFYSPTHDVLEVNKADYNSCRITSPIRTHRDGATVIPLDRPITRYFICATIGHCQSGMKLQVQVLPFPDIGNAPAPPQPPAPAASTTPTPIASGEAPPSPPLPDSGQQGILTPPNFNELPNASAAAALPGIISWLLVSMIYQPSSTMFRD